MAPGETRTLQLLCVSKAGGAQKCEATAEGDGGLKSKDPARRAKAIVEATTHFNDPDVIARVSEGIGEPMRGLDIRKLPEGELLQVRGV